MTGWRALAAAIALVCPLVCALGSAQAAAAEPKVLRYAFRVAETGFDPAQISDLYSRVVAASIFDAPLEWEFLARPVRYRANTLSALPEVSADFKTFTFHVKPGIYFSDDPAFKGQRRELVAADYVYSWKRHYDPQWKSNNLYILENAKLLGLSELRDKRQVGQRVGIIGIGHIGGDSAVVLRERVLSLAKVVNPAGQQGSKERGHERIANRANQAVGRPDAERVAPVGFECLNIGEASGLRSGVGRAPW